VGGNVSVNQAILGRDLPHRQFKVNNDKKGYVCGLNFFFEIKCVNLS
jgi:hypothetical protein